jgi:hypothetical protein
VPDLWRGVAQSVLAHRGELHRIRLLPQRLARRGFWVWVWVIFGLRLRLRLRLVKFVGLQLEVVRFEVDKFEGVGCRGLQLEGLRLH